MNLSLIIGALIAITVVTVSVFIAIPVILKAFTPPSPINVEVNLKNNCTVKDDAFMIVTNPNNLRAYFRNGVAKLKIMSDWKIRLEANDKYPGFKYDGEEYSVKREMELIADCGTSKRLRTVLGSFREQFN